MNRPEIVVPARALVGEAPVWDDRTDTLIWVDILRCEIHRFDPSDGSDTFVRLDDTVSAARPMTDERLAVATGMRAGVYDPATGAFDPLGEATIGGRTNDSTIDPSGRFWVGTMTVGGTPGGALYRLDDDGLTLVVDGIGLSNGLGWSPDGTVAYYADTIAEEVWAYDADVEAGTITNRRVFADLHEAPGRPDGLAVDETGGVWVAVADSGQVRRFDADGTLDEVINVGTPRVTCPAFGGPDLSDLYMTTMCEGMRELQLRDDPVAGALLRVESIGVRGVAATRFAG